MAKLEQALNQYTTSCLDKIIPAIEFRIDYFLTVLESQIL